MDIRLHFGTHPLFVIPKHSRFRLRLGLGRLRCEVGVGFWTLAWMGWFVALGLI